MCPACLASVAWVAAGVTSTGGIAALVVSRLRDQNERDKEVEMDNSEKGTGKGVSR